MVVQHGKAAATQPADSTDREELVDFHLRVLAVIATPPFDAFDCSTNYGIVSELLRFSRWDS